MQKISCCQCVIIMGLTWLFSDQCLPVFHGIGTVIPVLKLLVKNLVVGKLAVEQ